MYNSMRRILCLGDSNTYGFDPRSFIGSRYPETVRWTCLLRSEDREVINYGQNGLCIPLEYQFPIYRDVILAKLPLDLIIVMLGSNDLLQEKSVPEIALKMERFLRFMQGYFRETGIFLISPPVMKFGTWVTTHKIINASRELAKAYLTVSKQLSLFYADAEDWKIELSYDGVHFTESGHAAFAKSVDNTLNRYLSGAENKKETTNHRLS